MHEVQHEYRIVLNFGWFPEYLGRFPKRYLRSRHCFADRCELKRIRWFGKCILDRMCLYATPILHYVAACTWFRQQIRKIISTKSSKTTATRTCEGRGGACMKSNMLKESYILHVTRPQGFHLRAKFSFQNWMICDRGWFINIMIYFLCVQNVLTAMIMDDHCGQHISYTQLHSTAS